jgi:solute carrier family 25 phosphate transporter 23/24/25/41
VREQGVKGLYKGLLVSSAGIAPFIGIKLTSFDILKSRFSPDRNSKYAWLHNLVIGSSAGTIAMLATYPLDLTRRLMQLNGQPGHIYKNYPDACMQLWRKDGPKGFFKGVWATFLKVAPMTAILFMVNERMKNLIGI